MSNLFTRKQIEKLLSSDRDGFDFIEKTRSRYVLYVFDRDDKFEIRLVCHYIDHFNLIVEEIYLEHEFVSRTGTKEELMQSDYLSADKQSLIGLICILLNKHKLLEGK